MRKFIDIRKLAAVELVWLGPHIILAEYSLGIVLPLALGMFTLRSTLWSPNPWTWQTVLGIWLVTIAANYVPLLLYALSIFRLGSAEVEGRAEMAHARRYGVQQAIILVPFLVVVMALVQERGRQPIK
jgi:hypothetical protein